MNSSKIGALPLLLAGTLAVAAAAFAEEDLPELTVSGQQIATTTPASTYASPVTLLEFDPRVDLQVRNLAEAQGDVTLRGGIFENTSFRIGAVTLFDPQTGHYSAEIPIATEMLETPKVEIAVDNAMYGFNSTVGSIHFAWSRLTSGGSIMTGHGNNALSYQRLHFKQVLDLDRASVSSWGVEADVSRSRADGSIDFGDHDFNRYNLRIQRVSAASQTDIFAGYQEKFFGWVGMYTGAAYAAYSPFETEDLQTKLLIINHQQTYNGDSYWQIGSYFRRHNDHYIFNRFSPDDAFVHETSVSSLVFDGRHAVSDDLSLNYSVQLTDDSIESTTLENNFTDQQYVKLAFLPTFSHTLSSDQELQVRFGFTLDDSSEGSRKFSPLSDVVWIRHLPYGEEHVYISYSQATQMPGYTAVGGATSGLFASNPNLGREVSRNLEIGFMITRQDWRLEAAVFKRWDNDLVDWTYSRSSPNARRANAVDIEVTGLELIASMRWQEVEVLAGYTYLDKDADYGTASVDASFYALNFAQHRLTAAAIWYPADWLEIRMDNEWRHQYESFFRAGNDKAIFAHLSLAFFLPQHEQLQLSVAAENLWNEDFQEVPGTPGRGRQISASIRWSW